MTSELVVESTAIKTLSYTGNSICGCNSYINYMLFIDRLCQLLLAVSISKLLNINFTNT